MNGLLMVGGSWLMAQGSLARARGRRGGVGGGVETLPDLASQHNTPLIFSDSSFLHQSCSISISPEQHVRS